MSSPTGSSEGPTPTEELSFELRSSIREGREPEGFILALIADRLDSQEATVEQLRLREKRLQETLDLVVEKYEARNQTMREAIRLALYCISEGGVQAAGDTLRTALAEGGQSGKGEVNSHRSENEDPAD